MLVAGHKNKRLKILVDIYTTVCVGPEKRLLSSLSHFSTPAGLPRSTTVFTEFSCGQLCLVLDMMMSQHTLLSLFVFASSAFVNAQSPPSTALEPLASKHFTWPDIPYQVTGDQGGIRGPQAGFNLCNSTTENQDSMCQVCLFPPTLLTSLFLTPFSTCLVSTDSVLEQPR